MMKPANHDTGRLAPCRSNGSGNESGRAQALRCRTHDNRAKYPTPDGLRRTASMVPLLKKRAAGRDISGLKAYEE